MWVWTQLVSSELFPLHIKKYVAQIVFYWLASRARWLMNQRKTQEWQKTGMGQQAIKSQDNERHQ